MICVCCLGQVTPVPLCIVADGVVVAVCDEHECLQAFARFVIKAIEQNGPPRLVPIERLPDPA